MKKYLIIFIGILLLVSLLFNFRLYSLKTHQELVQINDSLSKENQRLKEVVEGYKEKNKGLLLKISKSYKKNKKLVGKLERQIQKYMVMNELNTKLTKQNRQFKKSFRSYKKNQNLRVKKKIENKIITAPAKALPLLGTTAIVAMTVNDIKSICNEYEILNEFEKNVFETFSETNSSVAIKELCNYDIQRQLVPIIEEQYNQTMKSMSLKIGKTEEWIDENLVTDINYSTEDIYDNLDHIKGLLKKYGNQVLDKDYNKSFNNGKNFLKELFE